MSDTWDESDSPGVEDPEALRRAEEAVARESSPWQEPRLAPGEDWVPVARHVGETLLGGLQPVAVALQAAGIPVGWDPFDPREAPNFLPPLLGTPGRTFTLLVPASHVTDARDAIGDLRPDDVTFLWTGGGAPIETLPDPTPVTAHSNLSDNARLQNMAQGRSAGCALGLVAAVAIIVVGASFLLFAGIR